MKRTIAASLVVIATLAAGCASQPHPLVLDPVGPPDPELAGAGLTGTLMVFSAFDAQADFNDLPYLRHYTDYKILYQDGKISQTIHNDNGTLSERPKKVELPVGTYKIVARANGYGILTVPVVIRANQVTTVHLEGGTAGSSNSQGRQSNPVRLPDGEIVGWRAPTPDPAKQ